MTNSLLGTAAAMIEIAAAEIGYHEGANNHTKYQSKDQAWCGAFLMWCAKANQIEVPSVVGTEAGAVAMKKLGQWHETPIPGDFVFFDFIDDNKVRIQHVGIVEKVSANSIITIEGNTSDQVMRKTRKLGAHSQIVGYGRPNYRKAES